MGRALGILFFATTLFAQDQILYHAKIFTADPQNPYAEAVAIRDGKILAIGNLPEVEKAAPNATRTDLDGKSLFPGFIDSHSHSIDGGFNLTNADATEKVETFPELQAFVAEAKKTRRGMHGEILEILNRYGSVEAANARAMQYAGLARNAICGFPDSDVKRALLWAPEFVVAREK